TATDPGTAVFVGLAPRDEVARYLDGVAHDEVTRLGSSPRYAPQPGSAPLPPPEIETFWTERVAGVGTQTLDWSAELGEWSVVVANADASPGVAVEASAGVQTGALLPIGLGLLLTGLALIGAGTAVIVAAVDGGRPAAAGVADPTVTGPTRRGAPHPLVIEGHL